MPKFRTYNELQDYIVNILKKREKNIDDIIYYWLTKSRSSEMFYLNEEGKRVIDSDKAKEHLRLVTLYRMILDNVHPFVEQNLVRPELSSINPSYNAKVSREYEEKLQKEAKRRAYYDDFVASAKEIIERLELGFTISQLRQDFVEKRTVLKSLFKAIFAKYGIDLDDNALSNLFGKVRPPGEKYYTDTICLLTVGTTFNFALRYQFRTTIGGEANGIFSAFFLRAAGYLGRLGNEYVPERTPTLIESDNNPFARERQVIRILASAIACAQE